jgi:4-hydroxybenzoyl-CoA reductase subunit beta
MLPSFDLFIPESLSEALSFLSANQQHIKILAGGTDLVPSLKQRLFEPAYLLDLKSLKELHGITEPPDGSLRIGSLTTIAELAQNEMLHREFPVLAQAASQVAGPNLRNVGTIGGNICLDTRCYWYNQSFFWRKSCGFCIKKDGDLCHVAPGSKTCWAVYSGDMAAALLTLDAQITLASASAVRKIPLSEFFVNDGLVKNRLAKNEILTEIIVPAAARGLAGAYQKFRLRGSVDYPLAGVAVSARKLDDTIGDLRVALTAVNPLPLLLPHPWNSATSLAPEVMAAIQKTAQKTAKPLKTSASTMDYRRHMVSVLLQRALEPLA